MRPIGGWLSDRLGPIPVLVAAFVVAAALLRRRRRVPPPALPLGTAAFLGMAAALGAGTGAVFALVARLVPADRVGAVTGVVGAAGGLGGFFPPLVMGAVYGTRAATPSASCCSPPPPPPQACSPQPSCATAPAGTPQRTDRSDVRGQAARGGSRRRSRRPPVLNGTVRHRRHPRTCERYRYATATAAAAQSSRK